MLPRPDGPQPAPLHPTWLPPAHLPARPPGCSAPPSCLRRRPKKTRATTARGCSGASWSGGGGAPRRPRSVSSVACGRARATPTFGRRALLQLVWELCCGSSGHRRAGPWPRMHLHHCSCRAARKRGMPAHQLDLRCACRAAPFRRRSTACCCSARGGRRTRERCCARASPTTPPTPSSAWSGRWRSRTRGTWVGGLKQLTV